MELAIIGLFTVIADCIMTETCTRDISIIISTRNISIIISTRDISIIISTRDIGIIRSTRDISIIISTRDISVIRSTRDISIIRSTRDISIIINDYQKIYPEHFKIISVNRISMFLYQCRCKRKECQRCKTS